MAEEWISVAEAAARLKISPRAMRFRIERGEVRAQKRGTAWMVLWSAQGAQSKEPKERAEVDGKGNREAEMPKGKRKWKEQRHGQGHQQEDSNPRQQETSNPRYAKELSSLAAFRILRSVFDQVPPDASCVNHRLHLHAALRDVTRGYYQWRRDAKLRFYNEARNWVADAILELILHPLPDATLTGQLVRVLENDALAALVGLSRRFEGQRRDTPL